MRDLYAHLLHVFGHSFVLIRQLLSKSVYFKGEYVGFVFVQFLFENFSPHQLNGLKSTVVYHRGGI